MNTLWPNQHQQQQYLIDGIYPGKYTYNENISPQEQAQVAMENYDPNFKSLVKKGDILISAFNFGTGSSRY